jgi:competence protein CoiA
MKFSLVDGVRREPAPKLKGACCFCKSPTLAKCGNRKVWHWAHESLSHCDSWWENETPWHRAWKSHFPDSYQEIVHFDDVTGEKHVADIKTSNGMVIEIQNSPMNEVEMALRENFYNKMMWIVNGEKFRKNFTILGKLPNPTSSIAEQLIFLKPSYRAKYSYSDHMEERPWWHFALVSRNQDFEERLKENNPYGVMVEICSGDNHPEVLSEIEKNYVGHHVFVWKRPRQVWAEATKPVFFDFGGAELWRLMEYRYLGLNCVKKISKASLIEKNGGTYAPYQA